MALVGTIRGVQLMNENFGGVGVRKTAMVTADFGAYTSGGSGAQLSAVDTAIANEKRNGKTITLRYAMPGPAGGASGTAVYAAACTVSGSNITFNLANAAGTDTTAAATTAPVTFWVSFDES